MSQLNMQQILSGDNLSTVVEKLNYNFNQIVLNGGGPQGLKGIIGAPGLPGAQGLQGLTGPVGEEGTHLYADGASPGNYPFGTGGEMLPRTGDVFVETDPTYLNIYQYAVTGGTGNYWNFIETIQAPGSAFSKLVDDYVIGGSATWVNASNDPAIAGKLLFGSPDALTGNLIIDPSYPISTSAPKLRSELSSPVPFGNSLATFASNKNQLRILDHTRAQSTFLQKGGGIVHSVETLSSNQIYRIINGDQNGENHFTFSLNNGIASPTLLYADTQNRLGIGVSQFTPLVANTTVNGSLAVGSLVTSFYLASTGATLSAGIGAIIEGNVAIGRNSNLNATLGVYNLPGAFGSSIKIDTDQSAATSSAVADLFFGGGIYSNYLNTSSPVNYWRFRHDSHSSPSNLDYRKFTLFGSQQGLTSSTIVTTKNAITVGMTASGAESSTQVSIDSIDLFDKFEVGSNAWDKVSIGNPSGTDVTSAYTNMHLGFNLSRNAASNVWRRMSDGANNAGRTFWAGPYTGLGLSLFDSTGAVDVTNMTDAQIHDNTRLYIGTTGKLSLSESRNAYLHSVVGANYPLSIDFGATGTTGEGADSNNWRRFIATFGDGPQVAYKLGTPLIASTNGVTQSISTGINIAPGFTASILPHYTWYGADRYGLYLSQGSTANSSLAESKSVGLSVDGTAVVTATGIYNSEKRVGILQTEPLERLHVGTKLVYHDGASKFIGYNVYYDQVAGVNRRAYGSAASGATQEGAFSMRYLENNRVDGTLGLNRYTNLGTKLSLIPYNAGGTASSLPNDSSGKMHRSLTISPPAVGPISAGWSNLAPFVPQVTIGLNISDFTAEQDSSTSLKRGTLSLAAQLRIKPASAASPATGPFGFTIEDQYNLGLYSYDGYPVSGIYANGGNPASTTKSFGINFLGSGGNAIAGDVPFLMATVDKSLTLPYQRIANFGAGFRVGVNYVPQNQAAAYTLGTDPTQDLASLVVGGYAESIPGGSERAIIAKGIITIDQSIYSGGGGGNQGLVFKDNTILAYGATARPSVSEYYGDWGIQYSKFSATEAGLNFWKPFGGSLGPNGNGRLYLSDSGSVSVGYNNPDFTPFFGTNAPRLKVNGHGYYDGVVYAAGSISGYNNTGFPITGMWFSASETNGLGVLRVSTSPTVFGGGAGSRSYSVRGSADIWSGGLFVAASDERIKDVVSIPTTSESLDIIKNIRVTDYAYKDSIKNPGVHRKLIAQNVKEHLPSAVSLRTDFIPNVYSFSKSIVKKEDLITIELENVKDIIKGDIIKISIDEQDTVREVTVLSVDKKLNTFSIEPLEGIGSKVFVYGKRIDDFLTLDYDSVFSTNVAATQELVKIIDSQAETIKNLENKLSKIEELLAKNNIR